MMIDAQMTDNEDTARDARLSALGVHIGTLRDEAIKGRAASGIEAEWLADEEYFQGIDNANRAEAKIKPTSPDGRVMIEQPKTRNTTTRSTVFVNITRPYVNAAAAKVADMLLPTDQDNFEMIPTPVPDLIKQSEDDKTPAINAEGNEIHKPVVDEQGQSMSVPHVMNGQPMMDEQGQPVMVPASAPASVADVAKQTIKKAQEACEKASTQISDWLAQGKYNNEFRAVIEDSARIGTGVMRGPFPEYFRRRAVVSALNGIGMEVKEEIAPRSRRIDVWNLYPDPTCGENIHNGKYLFERDSINSRQLQELAKVPGYLKEAINAIIAEGPKNSFTGKRQRDEKEKPSDKEMYDIWYGSCYLSKCELTDAGYTFEEEVAETKPEEDAGLIGAEYIDPPEEMSAEVGENLDAQDFDMQPNVIEDDEYTQYPAMVVMVNDKIIKAAPSLLDSGEFPYDVMAWQRRSGHWSGIGVSRQMRTSQDGVNAGTRNMMDNAGSSGGPILIIDRSKLQPADGSWEMRPRKVFYTTDAYEGGNIRDAITWIITPSIQQELMNIISFWLQRAEDETGLPMILQGQQGKAPDTVGGMTMLNNNASAVLRRIARIFDQLTESHLGRYYEWLLLHGKDDSAKGDFDIIARGSSALIERDAHAQLLPQLLDASLNPAYGLDPELLMAEILRTQRFDAESLVLSEEKKEKIAASQAQNTDPRLQVAQMNMQDKQAARESDQAMEQARQTFEAQEAERDRLLKQWEKNLDAQIDQARQSGDMSLGMDTLKVAMARDTAKLRTQMKLAGQKNAPQVATPAVEPFGKAPPGQAFQK